MKYNSPLLKGVFLKRYKRFFADIRLNGKIEVAHVANTGSLKSINLPGQACLVSLSDKPERKLKYSLQAILSPLGSWVGVNTALPNQLVKEAFENRLVEHWSQYDHFKPEVKLNAETRLDALLTGKGKAHYVEVKNVTLAEEIDGKWVALFPDAVTERGQKHLRELIHLVSLGHGAEIFFTVQRLDCEEFRPAHKIDPAYAELLKQAVQAGVKVSAYLVAIDEQQAVLINKQLKVVIPD